ncbi:ABC transporter G family member 36 [Dichanthelium oligosanthes]|uniref:ABC transporter G family member 36 n=1 Tax=Dichanthelium oligosanthes TaxID=888268 RepID=A0A1E5UTJ6_9POAL|nr:ABC transporter G family member 36 [Dichanthelium oligosanthes]
MDSAGTETAQAPGSHSDTVRPRAGDGDDGGVDEEEEARLWAELERLPTPQRARSAVMTLEEEEGTDDGACRKAVVDVGHLGPGQRRALLDRLVGSVDRDNERFLRKLRERIDRYGAANALRILPSRKLTMPILNGISGIIKPRRMTLLLGPPGSGKTTLLLALAGRLGKDLKVSGNVTYNGHGMGDFVPQRTAAYVSQHDLHIGEMTVRETLAFSARCQGVGYFYDLLCDLLRREKEANIKPDADLDAFMKAAALGGQEANVVAEYMLKILGLEICADTMVGDEMFRGISGGQRKRVTAGEILVGSARALFMDEISNGLDSSTTFQIINSLRQAIHILDGTALISLLQPAPETYNLFDDIILLSDGQIVYHGPREDVLDFFESMGFRCPDRKGVADFLQEVTSKKDQKQYWAHHDQPYHYISVKEFAESFHLFHVGQAMANKIAVPFDKSMSHPSALATSKYGVSIKELLKANIDREILLMKRNSFFYMFRVVQLILLSVIEMTLFFRTQMHHDSVANGGIYMGALFFTTLMIIFNGFSELTLTIFKLPIFFKQRDLFFYPAWTYTVPSWILKIPITFLEVGGFVFITYYAIGFDPDVVRLVKQYVLFLAANQMAASLFRFIAGAARNMIVAYVFGSFAILVVMLLGGFVLSRDNLNKWWLWGYWTSPMMYVQNAVSVNEFLGQSWKNVLPGSTEPLGVLILKSRGIFPEAKWYWIGFGALLGFTLLFNSLFTLCLAYLKYSFAKIHVLFGFTAYGLSYPSVSEEALKDKHANLTGVAVDVSLHERKGLGSNCQSSESACPAAGSYDETKLASVDANSMPAQRGMVLPFVPLSLTFDSIRYSVDVSQEIKAQVLEDKLEILKGVSGSFRPGVLTALMGISGAGKTTLMDVLAGRKTSGYTKGSISISGYPKKQETFARVSGYCEQDDIHSPQVTVHESLLFSAWLRLPGDVSSKTRKMFIEEVMELMELTQVRDALVGLPGVNGLSTEQRKRLTIAVELVANPSIIFMDEPTSGLDARAAAIVMRTVRNTVDTGRTVVCTIHQPSIDIFEAFDELLLLKQGGEEIYFGPLGHRSLEMIKYFEEIEGVVKIKDGHNPATWMLEVTSVSQEIVLGVDFSDIYKNSELYQRNKALIHELSTPPEGSSDLYFPTTHSRSFFTQCLACLWKQNLSYWRNPQYNAVRFFFTTIISLLFGTIFWGLGAKREKPQDLFNAMGSMYAAVLTIGVLNAASVQPVVSVERMAFYRERAAGMYSAFPYAFGQTCIYGAIVYAMMGFKWTVPKFFWYLFFMYFTLLYFTFCGMMAIGLTQNHNVASIVSAAFHATWNLFSGFLIPRTVCWL